ncbi:MAG: hypothetical protein A2X61_00020 [Ignavibacteria bacterium GWB2_35_12]|nr:MAG: hypothetical protein A2X61_00020 [Ignavibacteria bacterium GWB2_35_12]OGU96275.1 MAG: hypothetical protein A2220_07330 [Ignavibacteria bacterium RIFOXYA2_FULL_35_10]OGV20696.1 MAG: hypothetical protein A2475_05845 [Ignavibacteria bacterium RIFOXYC2_FULL_35_21]
MKKLFLFLFILLPFLIFGNVSNSYAKIADYPITVQDASDSCEHGRQIIWMDSDGDNQYDKVRTTNCDGSYSDGQMRTVGSGSLPSGAGAEVLSGDIDGPEYVLRIYQISTNNTIGYQVKEGSSTTVTFYYVGYYNP